jgi:hypothetical protein
VKAYEPLLVKYVVGDVNSTLTVTPSNYMERRLVLTPHDEMVSQAHDGEERYWALVNKYCLWKKGAGCGLHSGMICLTVSWLSEACKILEYGKNHEGYWTRELFVKQACFASF